jgi:hypothetical protein
VTRNYDRATEAIGSHKRELLQIAEELLIREVLDADQVRRIVRGEALEEPVPTPDSSAQPPDGEADHTEEEHKPIVPALPSLDKAVPQE